MRNFKDTSKSKICKNCGNEFFRDTRNTYAYWGRAKFCSRECSSMAWTKLADERRITIEEAFWRKAKKGDPNDCWEWSGLHDQQGYPVLPYNKNTQRACRVAAKISCGEIKKDEHACHRCGNKRCCNPSHIYAGSPKQNNSDKLIHGTQPMGESSYQSKLRDEQIREIRASKETNSKLGIKYGVSSSNISMIRTRRTWRHVK